MLTKLPRSLVNGLLFGAGFILSKIIVKTVLRSFWDAFRCFGVPLFACYAGVLVSMVWSSYDINGITYAYYTSAGLLLIHTFMWATGFFKT